jgi:outer membrane immunogenic protein
MSSIRKQLIGSVAASAMILAGAPTVAQAADLFGNYSHDWSGFYIGALVGAGGYDPQGDFDNDNDSSAHRLGAVAEVGVLGGLQAGWNYQTGNLVFGLEGDISATGLDRGVPEAQNAQDVLSYDVDYFATARARLGIADNDVLAFVSGGVAFTGGSLANSQTNTGLDVDAVGGVVGAGLEWAATSNVSIKVEGLYAFFDKTVDLNNQLGEGTTDDFFDLNDMVVARVGANWRFGAPASRESYDADETERDWTGPYIGLLVGAGAVQTNGNFDSADNDSSEIFLAQSSTVGLLGGGTAGWNIQNGDLVFGVEGDISFVDWNETSFQMTNTPDGINFDADLLTTVRGRVGYADGDVLIYGTAGVALLTGGLSDNGGSAGADGIDILATGGVFGAGIEWAATENLSVKAEALYVSFNDSTDFNEAGSADTGDAFVLNDVAIARVGLNWAFPSK